MSQLNALRLSFAMQTSKATSQNFWVIVQDVSRNNEILLLYESWPLVITTLLRVWLQGEQTASWAIEFTNLRFKGLAFSQPISTEWLGAAQSMHLETEPVILEKSCI
jgi:hypothetical protein